MGGTADTAGDGAGRGAGVGLDADAGLTTDLDGTGAGAAGAATAGAGVGRSIGVSLSTSLGIKLAPAPIFGDFFGGMAMIVSSLFFNVQPLRWARKAASMSCLVAAGPSSPSTFR